MLGGCGNMNQTNANEGKEQNETTNAENQNSDDRLVRVQDYTGEGYTLRNGEKTDKIAQENKEEITEAVEKFFLEKYMTEVIVHNMVGAVDGATVFVESVGEPHFYTYAIVPIDVDQRKVLSDNVWSQEGQVEDAIITGIFAMIFQEELTVYEDFVNKIVEKHPVTGITEDALKNVRAGGHGNTYYYTNTYDPAFDKLVTKYLENPDTSQEEWKSYFGIEEYSSRGITLTLYLYMEEPNAEPDKDVFNDIVNELEELEGVPKAYYSVVLNDNFIDKTNALGLKENTLRRSSPDYIIKE
jgi:hypothetical protein